MQRPHVVLSLLLGIMVSSCFDQVSLVGVIRPIVRVSARDFTTGQRASNLEVGESTRLMLMVYSRTDSLNDPGVGWRSRNAAIASNLGSTVTGRAAGTTFIVGEISDAGLTYRDSVQVTVTSGSQQ